MFDLHAHILPMVDDGPQSIEDAVDMLAALAQEGVTDVVATPHYDQLQPHIDAEEARTRTLALQRVARTAGLEIRLWVGHEAHLPAPVELLLARNTLATVNDGPYILLEAPRRRLPADLPALVERLRQVGYVPIFTDIEMCVEVQRNPEALTPLVQAGALTQVALSSLLGARGDEVRQTAEILLTLRLTHVLASSARPGGEPLRIVEGIQTAQALVGRARTRQLTIETPAAIVRGDPLTPRLDDTEIESEDDDLPLDTSDEAEPPDTQSLTELADEIDDLVDTPTITLPARRSFGFRRFDSV